MPDYRLTTETGEVVASATLEHDRAAVTWRTTHPFEAPQAGEGDSRQLRLEREDGGRWVRIETPMGTADVS